MQSVSWAKFLNFVDFMRQNAETTIAGLYKFIYIRIYLFAVVVLNLVDWLVAYYLNTQATGDRIISLHYNVDFGVNLIGDASQIYTMPAIGSIVFIFNLIILIYFYRSNRFLSHLLLATALLCNLGILMSLDIIYLINFR